MNDTTASDPYQDYYREVELHWSWRRGNQIIVSPIEFEHIEAWFEGGVPLAVVLRAIDLFVEKKEKTKRKTAMLLNHAESTVQKVFKEYQTLHVGASSGEQDLLVTKMRALTRKVRALAKKYPDLQTELDQLREGLGNIPLKEAVHYEELDKSLSKLDNQLLDLFRPKLAEEDRQSIREEIEEVLKEEEDPEFFKRMMTDSIRFFFGLPKLHLLG